MTLPPDTIAAVIGSPIKQSKSPLIHNHWLQQDNIPGVYVAHEIIPEQLKERLSGLKSAGLKGFNVTIPHKDAMMALCDEVDARARAIGAVNTVSVRDGRLWGTNTDAYGFIENIRSTIPGSDFTAGPALVIGAGGAARAVIYGLLEQGVPQIFLSNRTQARGAELAAAFGARVQVVAWDAQEDILERCTFVVNTTSLGMTGQPPLELDLSLLRRQAVVCDIVYNPLVTGLLAAAEAKGCRTVGGLGMLVYQAAKAYETWFGHAPVVDDELMGKLKAAL